jgi:transcriptional regulator with XRE-family HTH domain
MDFGKEVRRRREALGLTLEELAERAGLTPNYVGTVETGKRDPSLSTVLALAKGLRVPPAHAELRGHRRDGEARPLPVDGAGAGEGPARTPG